MSESNTDHHDQQAVRERKKTQRPRPWKVLLHNDDFTTMEFVIHILITYFRKTETEATYIMLQVHRKGTGTAGVYPRDVAETKVREVTDEAREHQMPLKVTTEPE
jgi:ATP-dependent Clp protease adaptor protein ClpS